MARTRCKEGGRSNLRQPARRVKRIAQPAPVTDLFQRLGRRNGKALGIGSYIAGEALADARKQGKYVVPKCPFIADYLRKHREDAELVKPDMRTAFRI